METERNEHVLAMQEAMRILGLPPSLQVRINTYNTYERLHRSARLFDSFFTDLSPQLKFELQLHLYLDVVVHTGLFRNMRPRVLGVGVLCSEGPHLPARGLDLSVRRLWGLHMAPADFMVTGQSTVIAKDTVSEIKTLERGASFGEVALLTGVPRTAYVRANTFCITAHLTKEGFEPIVHKWPEEIDVLLSGIEAEADRQKIKEEATKHYRLGGRRRSSLSSFGVPSPPSGAHRGAGRLSVGSGPGRRPRGRRAPWRAGEPAWRPRRRPPLGRRGAAAPLVLVGKPGGAGGEPLSPLSPLAPASPASPPAPAWRDPLPPTTRPRSETKARTQTNAERV
ncbi:unnamed protein product [Prorocentrum cordatum]|uniref:Cyclic nucleotide-binding domain-containing protein n=1 Tax=Prorocentrum cordatum TaxID=2364126 RepID=A0ABN9SS88_9DINO|nr:unnamed protein product [Polarella glacialis]